ncbi:MAG: exosortase system-associated protein, TIGR04073 family [Verrucomicrobiota bacterium]
MVTGCSGPAYKLGRGINNTMEFTRLGELRRSMEQTALWDGPDAAYTTGFIKGFNRSVVRTVLGLAEVVTFPIPTPTYEPIYRTSDYPGLDDVYIGGPLQKKQYWSFDFMTKNPPYPTNFKPGILADTIWATDTSLGFAAGDIAPFVPGSRFHVFDY